MSKASEIRAARTNEDYLVQQEEGLKKSEYWAAHKARIAAYDRTYGGAIPSLVLEENSLPTDEPYIENKLKNATHDIKRLAREAKGVPVFTKEGEDTDSAIRAKMRAVIAQTIWTEGGGADVEGKFYLDLIRGGFCAVAVFDDGESEYPQFLRLDPANAYPTVINGRLVDMVYVEEVKERAAAALFPKLSLDGSPGNVKKVKIVTVYSKERVLQGVVKAGGRGQKAEVSSNWEHKLDRVPVAFKDLESADGHFRGLLDQLLGPMKGRNRAVRLMLDYLEDMVHAPWEEKGIENPPDKGGPKPGPEAVYHHNEDAEFETFFRRTPPAAPAGAVFGLLQYLDAQEQSEGFQPPSRVGVVRQSQASGNFVESTQGSLSSVVLEVQSYVAVLRREANKIAMMVDEKHLDREKPLIRAVGTKATYKPTEDIKGWYYHQVMYGAAAGLDRREADSRILQHLGAGVIPLEIARDQIDYIENDTNIQDDVDRDLLARVMFERLTADQTVTFADLAELDLEMGKGLSRRAAIEKVLPQLVARQKAAALAEAEATVPAGAPGPEPEPTTPDEQRLALEQGATPGVNPISFSDLNPRPIRQTFGGETGR